MVRKIPARRALASLLAAMLCTLSVAAWSGQDVVLLLDNSSSMKTNDPQRLTVQAVADFINSRNSETRTAIISFNATSAVLLPLTNISDATRRQVSDALRHLDYHGQWTDTASGLEQALSEIINHGDSDAGKSIILMTDGTLNLGNKATDQTRARWIMQSIIPAAIYNHVRIFGIAFTKNADYKMLRTLAEKTGGDSFQALQSSDLAVVFQRIGAKLTSAGLAAAPLAAPPSSAGSELPVNFNTPLTQHENQPVRTRWLWLVALLAVIAASFGIYAAWNMRLVRTPPTLLKPEASHTEGPRAVLYDISNPNDIKRFELSERATLLGRVAGYDPEVQYILVKEKTVGRCHAVIERRGHSFWIMDQGSINGTFVNSERINADRALKHGDIVAIHRHEFEFMIPEYFESESTVVGTREQLTG